MGVSTNVNNKGTRYIFLSNKFNLCLNNYNDLATVQNIALNCKESNVIISLADCLYIHAGFTAFIGSLKALVESKGKKLDIIVRKNSRVSKYYWSSGLRKFFNPLLPDTANKNVIPFRKINMEQQNYQNYIDHIIDLAPVVLSDAAKDMLFMNIYEIFINAHDHSKEAYGVYACGHWFPKLKELTFSIYDTGIGIAQNVKNHHDSTMSSREAVDWALKYGNSTRQLESMTPRGVGFTNLLHFLDLNHGSLKIFTNDIYFCHENEENNFFSLDYGIIGTMVTFTIVTDNEHRYILKSEETTC